MKHINSLLLILSTIYFGAFAQTPAKVHFDKEHFTEYIEGNMPLVISVPHGGATLLPEVPLRNCKGAVTVTDSKTIELAREIQKSFEEKHNLTPHIIICHLSRKNVDQNRAIEEGTCGNEAMRTPWNNFHHYIDSALNLAAKQYGQTVYIDLHGHGHKNQRLELGYLLKGDELAGLKKADKVTLAKKSSVNNLLLKNKKLNLDDLLIGSHAFGTIISEVGFPAVPSKQDKAPTADEWYFNGGYNTVTYTSSSYPNVFGFQIESNYKGVRDEAGRPLFADAFTKAYMKYIKKNTIIALNK